MLTFPHAPAFSMAMSGLPVGDTADRNPSVETAPVLRDNATWPFPSPEPEVSQMKRMHSPAPAHRSSGFTLLELLVVLVVLGLLEHFLKTRIRHTGVALPGHFGPPLPLEQGDQNGSGIQCGSSP
ncbi:prepilin-type N-terminal cleavage/methylation domain-containing protein, partial [Azotobacter beijerinckii]|uniref:prepilin-type N-terminal cleavage/methylation domain-containing protein n=1 Tax=Azotobacter beijerinckii TaxID=170623 RepID=UPI0029551A20